MSEQREILFRGKRVDNGECVEGYLIRDEACNTHIPYIGYLFGGRDIDVVEVDPSTVGQYTGLRDKNGTRIFEGDVAQTPKYGIDGGRGLTYSGKDKFIVGFSDGTFILENKLRRFSLRPDKDVEIIGNIHDNPELLETSR